MGIIGRKIEIIKRIVEFVEDEYELSENLMRLSLEPEKDSSSKCFIENIYFDLIKYIINLDDIPMNIIQINVSVDDSCMIYKYEVISSEFAEKSKFNIEIIFDK